MADELEAFSDLPTEAFADEPQEAPDDEPIEAEADDEPEAEAADEPEVVVAEPKKKRRRRRKPRSAAHEARIAQYRDLVADRGWIFAPPSPPQPVSWLFNELTRSQLESLSA